MLAMMMMMMVVMVIMVTMVLAVMMTVVLAVMVVAMVLFSVVVAMMMTVVTVMMVLAVMLVLVLPELVRVDDRGVTVSIGGGGKVILLGDSCICGLGVATVTLGISEAGHERERRRHGDEDAGVYLHVKSVLIWLVG